MKFRVETGPFAEAVSWVTKGLPRRPVVPTLNGLRISAADGVVTMRAFDYDTSLTVAVVADVHEDGELLVSGSWLAAAATGARAAEVEVIFDAEQVTVASGRATYRARPMSLEDYPKLPDLPARVGIINPDVLSEGLAEVIAAVRDDDTTNERVRGLHIEGGERLTLVGTDGYRFHTTSLPWDSEGEFSITVPVGVLVAASKGLRDAVSVHADADMIGLSDGTHIWTTRAYATEYAPWRSTVQQTENRVNASITIDGAELLKALKTVGALAESAVLGLEYADGELSVFTVEQESGEATEVIEADGTAVGSTTAAEPFQLGVNPRYLSDLIAATSCGPIDLRYVAGSTAGSQPFMVADPARPHLTLLMMSKRLGGTA